MRHATLGHLAILGSLLAACPAPAAEPNADLITWIVQEQDREDIKDTINRYFMAFDRHDYAILDTVFAAGGKLYLGGQEIVDPGKTIAGKIEGLIRANPQVQSVPDATDHYVERVNVDLHGDTAKVECFAVAYLVVDEGTQNGKKIYVRGLHYFDDFVKVGPRQWRIRERRHNLEWMFKADATVGLALADRKKRN